MLIVKEEYKLVNRIIKFYKPYISKIVVILFLIIITTGINMLMPLMGKLLMDEGFIKMNYSYTVKYATISVLLALLGQCISAAQTYFMIYINNMASFSMNKIALKQLLKIKIQYFANKNFSEIMNNINMDIDSIQSAFKDGSINGITEALGLVGGIIGLVLIDWRLTAIVLISLPIRYGIVKFLTKINRRYMEIHMEAQRDYASWYGDIIGGIKEIRLWGITGEILRIYVRKQRKIIEISRKRALLNNLKRISQSMFGHLLINTLYIIGAYYVIGGDLSLGSLLAFITYSSYVTLPMNSLLDIWYSICGVIPAAERFFDFLDMQSEQETLKEELSCINMKEMGANIKFENICFSYEKDKTILKDINFEIKNREKVAIIGPNGTGKSTIINHLLRMYEPDSGRILINGININRFKLKAYRKMISVVNQDTYLFNASVYDNITLFVHNDKNKVYKAAKDGCIHDFIQQMPHKYKSYVGRNGTKLSGGQRQKIAIARAFLKESAIMVFDEATSNCDTKTEIQINNMIKNNFSDKTVIIVTHRMNILKNVDRILHLDNQLIKEIGTFDDLLSKMDIYRTMLEGVESDKMDVI